ncbi:RNA polymerase sigma factor [Pedobacter boryungensis]|uniref:Sigma-70 family RNA polymerase sigma factor n=1 Tax=Pedobacter boryungensis TaxID=869962 RepID=A0ABX2DG37_9SPHI|nr:sigma-70 family RNA polymerase sigma factor [Pedobacter boryungensis]NQX32997.1 sigma-70 family RNA polymerase sigma factor [Pedobacter boryungensis]
MSKPQPSNLDDLIRNCKTGNLQYQEMLYKHFYGYALGICLRYLINREDALEAANDGFIKAFKYLNTFKEGADFKPWFRKILVNTSLDYKRKNMRFSQAIEMTDTVQQTTYSSAVDKLSVKDILSLMKHLNETQHLVFNLYEIDGYTHKEIGELLNIPESSSRTYLSRAKQVLQNLLITHSIYTK